MPYLPNLKEAPSTITLFFINPKRSGVFSDPLKNLANFTLFIR